jgi:hypothetical protein
MTREKPFSATFKLEKETKPWSVWPTIPSNSGCLVHIAGYVRDGTGKHPEFYFVRNITGLHPSTGAYLGADPRFTTSEDFWTRDFAARPCATASPPPCRARSGGGLTDAGSGAAYQASSGFAFMTDAMAALRRVQLSSSARSLFLPVAERL